MKNINTYIRFCLTGLLMAGVAGSAVAQEQLNTPAAYEIYKQRSLWMQSSNAAGSFLDNPIDYTELEIGYRWKSGNYHLPQQGAKDNSLLVGAEGAAVLPNFYAWGSFNHDRNAITDASFNVSAVDPLRNMPFYYADNLLSDWRNQFYNFRFRLSTQRLWKAIYFGLDGRYDLGSAAKQRDMRTASKSYFLQLQPGVVWDICYNHALGVNFDYYSYKEEASVSKVNTDASPIMYEVYGLGTSVEQILLSSTLNYVGNCVGGSAQYNFRTEGVNILISGGYTYRVEDVDRSFEKPERKLTLVEKSWKGDLMLTAGRPAAFATHVVKASYLDRKSDGMQFITQQDATTTLYQILYKSIRSQYELHKATVNYSFMINRSSEYRWKVDAGAQYTDRNDTYLMPRSVFQAENLAANLGMKKNFALRERLLNRLLVGIKATYNMNLSSNYEYNGGFASSPIVTGLMQGNYDFLTTDAMIYSISAIYSQKINPQLKANLFVRLAFDYANPSGSRYDDRTVLRVGIGCNF